VSPLIGLALSAHILLQAAPCEGRPLEVPYGYEGAWADEDQQWISNELQSWFAARGREGCASVPSLPQERLVLVLRSPDVVGLEIRRGAKVIGERTLALDTVPLEGRTYAIAALAEELARSLWERPIRRDWTVGLTGGMRQLYAGPTILGVGISLGWAPITDLTFELAVHAGSIRSVSAPHGQTGGLSIWGELGARYGLLNLGPVTIGPRLGIELGRLLLWGEDTVGLRKEGGAWWSAARGGLFLSLERERWALRLSGSMGRTLSGAIVLDEGQRVMVLDGAVGEVALTIEVRL
jgi:hypothetical protein